MSKPNKEVKELTLEDAYYNIEYGLVEFFRGSIPEANALMKSLIMVREALCLQEGAQPITFKEEKNENSIHM
jgi:hypothetical protein